MSDEAAIIRLEEKVVALTNSFSNYCNESEKLQVERAKRLQEQLQKTENTLNSRLEAMNEFRAQINQERLTYVTNEKLDLRLKPLERMFWGLSAVIALITVVILPLIMWLRG